MFHPLLKFKLRTPNKNLFHRQVRQEKQRISSQRITEKSSLFFASLADLAVKIAFVFNYC
jgi:hypothetical protein